VNRSTENRKRLVSITEGNLRNHHLYITGYHDFFPAECYGQSSVKKGTGRSLTLVVDGLANPVETDIARNGGNGQPRNFFRKRTWLGEFFEKHQMREGDVVAIERVDPLTYRVYPFKNRTRKRNASARRGRETKLFPDTTAPTREEATRPGFGDTAFTRNREEPLHRWVPWIAGFSAGFVQEVFEAAHLGNPADVTVLDPFAGVGTTLVEGLKRGYNVAGFEINPYAALACEVKVSCFRQKLRPLGEALSKLEGFSLHVSQGRVEPKARAPESFRSRIPFFSPAVEREVLLIQDFIADQKDPFVRKTLKLTLGAVMVAFSNYSYEPSLGTRSAAGKSLIESADVFQVFRDKLCEIEADISLFQQQLKRFQYKPRAAVYQQSYLQDAQTLLPAMVDVLVTSPPYLNNYHYIRNTRPQLHWLGLVDHNGGLKKLEQENFGRFWQTVRNGPPVKLAFSFPELEHTLEAVRERNPDKGIYGGGGWANYAATYFNDCAKFFEVTRQVMKPGGLVVIVIGNNIVQGVHIETDRFLAQIAERNGFKLEKMHQVRRKRTGSSIVNSSVRAGITQAHTELYETAVELRLAK
jgi:DNA modification methylase